jgi:transposase
VERVVIRTLETTPRGQTHWSLRGMAQATSLSRMTISRIWHAFGLQPHRTKTFKLSPHPLLIDKVRDVVGLYMNPPEHAVVLCVDEKAQIQALDRTQPLLPMRPGQIERRTHDYTRHGTTSLFAALDVKTSQVISQFHRRHRAIEFRKFLDAIDTAVPADLAVHLIMDNYGTHKTPLIQRWLVKRPVIGAPAGRRRERLPRWHRQRRRATTGPWPQKRSSPSPPHRAARQRPRPRRGLVRAPPEPEHLVVPRR